MKAGTDVIHAIEQYPPELQEIILAARRGKDRDWELVDERLLELVKHPAAIQWARKEGVTAKGNDGNENMRDLACSIFELHKGPLTSQDHHILRQIKRIDAHRPAGFRAACALFAHGERDAAVVQALEKASHHTDPVISTHAKELLAKLEKKEK